MKKIIFFLILFLGCVGVVAGLTVYRKDIKEVVLPIGEIIRNRPLERYTIENLSKFNWPVSQITLDEPVATTSAYTTYKFHYLVEGRKVSGLTHIPNHVNENQKAPVIVQLRGYVDREVYISGEGTRRSAEVYARNGFITIAPDFLGYGDSDLPPNNIFEERFQTYAAALTLLSSIKTLRGADAERVGIWGHSNGGQIALTVLEATGGNYPTVLWAPVSKAFPYSILYYTDELSDRGKFLRKELAKFEEDYDVEPYSIPNYLHLINAPILLHQGTADEVVPKKWSDELAKRLKELDKEVTYRVYSGADHNLVSGWDEVVGRDVEFFREKVISKK